MNKLFLLLIFVLVSCATPEPETPVAQSVVPEFIQQWEKDWEPESKESTRKLEAYLTSAERIFHKHGRAEKFPSYLQGMKNSYQLLAHTEFNLPKRYRSETGHYPAVQGQAYKDYKYRFMRYQEGKLNQEREAKLRRELPQPLFQDLYRTYYGFRAKNESGEMFPF